MYHNGPSYSGNALSLMTFWPANKLVSRGSKVIMRKNVWKLQESDAAECVWNTFNEHWKKEINAKE